MYLAAFGGRAGCLAELLKVNAVLSMKDNQGRGPLHVGRVGTHSRESD